LRDDTQESLFGLATNKTLTDNEAPTNALATHLKPHWVTKNSVTNAFEKQIASGHVRSKMKDSRNAP